MNLIVGGMWTLGGIFLAVAGVHFTVGLRGYQVRREIWFALAALAAAGDSLVSPSVYQAATIDAFLTAHKWSVLFQASFGLALVWFLVDYTKIRMRLVPWILTGLYGLHTLIHALSPYGIQFQQVLSLHKSELPYSESLTYGVGSHNPLGIVGDFFGLGILLFSVAATVSMWRYHDRRRAVVLAVSLGPLMLVALPIGILIDHSVLKFPYMFTLAFLGLVTLMNFELVSEVVRSSILAREVTANEERWRSLLDNVRLLVAGIDQEGIIDYVNPHFCLVTGFSAPELYGRPLRELLADPNPDQIEELFGQSRGKDRLPLGELAVLTKTGPPRRVAWSNVILQGPIGGSAGALGIGVDVTEQVEAEQTRDRALRELVELKTRLEAENVYLKEELESGFEFSQIVGQSDVIKYVLHMVRQVATTDATVLIEGETGVGKELVARAVHEHSARSDRPFVRVNCAALPANLVEAELFGHEKGAFTGADRLRKGRFEMADGGTFFLDEVGELTSEIQAKLLRVIQEGEFERVGSSKTLKVNVRIVAATNCNLLDAVAAGRFREDLFYRMNVYPITIPSLRDRREDIPLLVRHFVQKLSVQHHKSIDEIPGRVMHELTIYDWPGNVRELINVLERAVITSPGLALRLPGPLLAKPRAELEVELPRNLLLTDVERKHIIQTLESTHWRISGPSGAAKLLGLNPSTLRSRMKNLKISSLRESRALKAWPLKHR